MTTKTRAPLFNDDDDAPSPAEALKNFDPKAFEASKPGPLNDRPDKEAVRKAGRQSGFDRTTGLGPTAATPTPTPARRRNHTGRSEQVNIKATPEFKARFQALAAKQDWTDAVTFEKAIELLEKHCI